MTKEVFLEFAFNPHPAYRCMIQYPPTGYRFLYRRPGSQNLYRGVSRMSHANDLKYAVNQLIPLPFTRSLLGMLSPPPKSSCITLAVWHAVFRNEPWIMEVGGLVDFGPQLWQMRLLRSTYQRAIESENCKTVITYADWTTRELDSFFKSRRLSEKIRRLPHAVEPKYEYCSYSDTDRPVILFVGSGNQSGEFLLKGGPEVIAMFERVSNEFPKAELWIRSDMPSRFRAKCAMNPKITVFENLLPRDQLVSLYLRSHVFVQPSHYEEWATILEAMSFGLPVVACAVYGQNEVVEDGVDGILVKGIPRVYDAMVMRYADRLPEFNRAVTMPNPVVVEKLAAAVTSLLRDASFRRRLGGAGTNRILTRNSLQVQRSMLKEILDIATA